MLETRKIDTQIAGTELSANSLANHLGEKSVAEYPAPTVPHLTDLSISFRTKWGEKLALNRLWTSGVAPGGILNREVKAFNTLEKSERLFRLLYGDEMLEGIRCLGREALVGLRTCGAAALKEGIPPNAHRQMQQGAIYLSNGESLSAPHLEKIALLGRHPFTVLRALTWELPDPSLHFKKLGKVQAVNQVETSISNRDLEDAWAIPLTLAGMPGKEFQSLLEVAPELPQKVLSPLELLTVDELKLFCVALNKAWFFRKRTNIEDIHEALTYFETKGAHQDKDKTFILVFGLGLLKMYARRANEVFTECIPAGNQLIAHGWDPNEGLHKPFNGTLHLADGTSPRFNPHVRDVLACDRHDVWVDVRDKISLWIPNRNLHQPPRVEHARWDRALVPDERYNPDRLNVWFDALMLARLNASNTPQMRRIIETLAACCSEEVRQVEYQAPSG